MSGINIEKDIKKIPKHDVIGIVIAIIGVVGIYVVYKKLAGSQQSTAITPQVATPVTDSGSSTTSTPTTPGAGISTNSTETSTITTPQVVTVKTALPGEFGFSGQPLYAENQQVVMPTATNSQSFSGTSSSDSGSLSALTLTQGTYAQRAAQETQNTANEASILGGSNV